MERRVKTVLFELPAWSFGQLNGIPSYDVYTKAAHCPPRGIGQIAADLRHGIGEIKGVDTDIKILDPRIYGYPWHLPEEDLISACEADVLGGSAISRTIPQTIAFFAFAKTEAKRRGHNVITVLGGVHGTARDEECLRTGMVDYVVRGEGSLTAIELWKRISCGESTRGIEGISYLDEEGRYVREPDRKPLSEKQFSMQHLPEYPSEIMAWVNLDVVHTSLGCPYDCEFCCMGLMGGACNYRRGSMERALRQIEKCYEDHPDGGNIFFGDSNFAPKGQEDWVLEFLNEITRRNQISKKYGGKVKRLMAQVDVPTIFHPDFLRLYKAANGFGLYVGVEGINGKTLRDWHKPTTPELNLQVMRVIREAGVWGHAMTLDQVECVADLELLLGYLKHGGAGSANINAIIPLPGSRLEAKLRKEDRLLLPFDGAHLKNYSLLDGKYVVTRSDIDFGMSPYERQLWLLKAHKELSSYWAPTHLYNSARISWAHLAFDLWVRRYSRGVIKDVVLDQQTIDHLQSLKELPSKLAYAT